MNTLYPFASKHITIDNLEYHYIDEGKGETVIMVHGNPTWSFFFRDVIKNLQENYRCIAVDHIGCGLSSKPQDYQYTLSNHIKNLITLIKDLNLSFFNLIVHDWGGAIGLGLANHFKDKVRHIIPMNTVAFALPHIPKRISLCRLPILGKIVVQGFNAFAKAATTMTTVKPLTQEIKDGFLSPYNNFANRKAVYEFVQDIPLNSRHRSWQTLQEIEQGLSNFSDQQFCFIWGMQDWCFDKRFLQHWQKLFPQAQIYTYDEAGHYLLEDEKEKIIQNIKDFLKKPLSF